MVVVEAILLLLLLVLLFCSVTAVVELAIIEVLVVFSVVPVPVVNLNEKRDLSMKESGTETENNL